MPEQDQPSSLSASAVRAQLAALAQVLHEGKHLGPEAQQLLAELLEELSAALGDATAPPRDLAHLTQCAAQLVQAAKKPDSGMLAGARDRLEGAVIGVETQFPTIAEIGRAHV